jgi:hypothetical protein
MWPRDHVRVKPDTYLSVGRTLLSAAFDLDFLLSGNDPSLCA